MVPSPSPKNRLTIVIDIVEGQRRGGAKNGQNPLWGKNIEKTRGPKNGQNSIWCKNRTSLNMPCPTEGAPTGGLRGVSGGSWGFNPPLTPLPREPSSPPPFKGVFQPPSPLTPLSLFKGGFQRKGPTLAKSNFGQIRESPCNQTHHWLSLRCGSFFT